ncbi:MAG: hypothetical protein J6P19_06765 [Acetobacter sp.]|nr:hypothetical protein [Acetobacter sp.]
MIDDQIEEIGRVLHTRVAVYDISQIMQECFFDDYRARLYTVRGVLAYVLCGMLNKQQGFEDWHVKTTERFDDWWDSLILLFQCGPSGIIKYEFHVIEEKGYVSLKKPEFDITGYYFADIRYFPEVVFFKKDFNDIRNSCNGWSCGNEVDLPFPKSVSKNEKMHV